MNEQSFAVMALVLGAACLLGALLSRREGADRRDVRLMLGSGAGLGGVALLLLAVARV